MNETTPKTSRESFIDAYDVLATSGVGVVMIHSREPHRVSDALQEWAQIKGRPFRTWNCRDGWMEYNHSNVETAPTSLETDPKVKGEPNKALKRIADVDGGGTNAWTEGLFVMDYPHWWLHKTPQMMQCLKIYVRDFAETLQRLVIVVPEGYALPRELENDIPILSMDLPHRDELRASYDALVEASLKPGQDAPFDENEIEHLMALGAGMTEMEFEAAVSKAIVSNKKTFPQTPLTDFAKIIMATKTEVIKRSEVLELVPAGSIDDIGGLDLVKVYFDDFKITLDPEFIEDGGDKAKGVVAIGPPGTGKSLLAKALGSIVGLPLVRFDISRVFAGIVGESEQKVRSALALLKAMAPCVVWVDEMDKAGIDPRQSGGDGGVSRRIMQAILTFQQENDCGIIWVMTANRSAGLPPELLRPGRMDAVFAILQPNRTERREVMHIHLRKRKVNPDQIPDLEVAITASRGYVSAEVEGAIKEAKKKSFKTKKPITGKMIAAEFKAMKPLAEAFPEDFAEMTEWAKKSARPSSTPEDEDIEESVAPVARKRSRGAASRQVETD